MDWKSKNCGIHPMGPAYDEDYDEEEDYLAYDYAQEAREEMWRDEREN